MPQTLTFAPPAISIDVEDWPQSSWDRGLPITERAAVNTHRVLQLLQKAGVRATMFVLGKFAEVYPDVVKRIRADGHEVACHGYGHVEIFRQSRKEFAGDVRRSKDLLEQILGEPVRGYRAPDFSIMRQTLWALEVLAEAGFEYDSSVVPVRLERYGIPEWPATPVRVRLHDDRTILEAPIATFRWLRRNWPVGGGGYHRLLPGFASRYFAGKMMASAPFVFYCHPYEFDVQELEELPFDIPFHVRLHQGAGRRWFEGRFMSFLARFGGQRMQEMLSSRTWADFDLRRFSMLPS